MSASFVLQEAVYAALAADAAVMGLVAGVYDHAPEDAALPYVQIGEAAVSDWSAGGMWGEEHRLTLHVWSAGRGQAGAKRIMTAVTEALDGAELALAGHHLVSLRFRFGETFRDVDRVTQHGVMRFHALTHRI